MEDEDRKEKLGMKERGKRWMEGQERLLEATKMFRSNEERNKEMVGREGRRDEGREGQRKEGKIGRDGKKGKRWKEGRK